MRGRFVPSGINTRERERNPRQTDRGIIAESILRVCVDATVVNVLNDDGKSRDAR